MFAYNLNLSGDAGGGLQLLQWSNTLFLDDPKTYESLGDLHKSLKNHTKASDFYNLFILRLEQRKGQLANENYAKYKATILDKIQAIGI
jgi:hypothetical protein